MITNAAKESNEAILIMYINGPERIDICLNSNVLKQYIVLKNSVSGGSEKFLSSMASFNFSDMREH
jgi:hypothetical protein